MGITIITEGSSAIGFGHIRRSATLASYLLPSAPVQVWIVSNVPNIEPTIDAHFEGIKLGCGPQPKEHADVEILDLEPPAMQRYLLRPPGTTKQLCLDLFDSRNLPDVTMNLIDHSQQMRAAYLAAGRNGDYIEGPECAIIRPSLCALRPSTAPTIPQVRRVVITLGGADPARRTLEAVAALTKYASTDIDITVIVGPLVPDAYEAEIQAAASLPARVLRAPKDYDMIVAMADVVLCNGGGTLLEMMHLGKPVVVFPQTLAEENHTRSHVKAGACVMAASLDAVMGSAELRSALAANAYRRIDGRGAQRIVEAALNLLSLD